MLIAWSAGRKIVICMMMTGWQNSPSTPETQNPSTDNFSPRRNLVYNLQLVMPPSSGYLLLVGNLHRHQQLLRWGYKDHIEVLGGPPLCCVCGYRYEFDRRERVVKFAGAAIEIRKGSARVRVVNKSSCVGICCYCFVGDGDGGRCEWWNNGLN